jgi:hypothetical protein
MDASGLVEFVQQLRLDVEGIADPVLRNVVQQVFNLVEDVVQHNQRLHEENIRLRDEIARLRELLQKAGVKPPPSKPLATNPAGNPDALTNARGSAASNPADASATSRPASKPSKDLSSEKERRSREPRQTRADRRSFRPVRVDRDVVCPVDPTTLPPDAVFVGYDDVVVQELVVKTDNVRYRCEIWISPTRGRFCGSLAPEIKGEFGPRLRTLLVSLKYVAGTSLPRARSLVEHLGIVISPASVVNILHDAAGRLRPEREAIFQAGLVGTSYQHVDDTSCRVGGEFWHTHVISSPLHASYFTRRGKDRWTALELLWGGSPTYRFDELTQQLLRDLRVPKKWRERAAKLPQEREFSEDELMRLLNAWEPPPPAASLAALREAAAIASYRARPDHVPILIGDDAKQWRHLSDDFGLCWVHEGRHYPKLAPVVPCHQEQLEAFQQRYWDFYGELQKYRTAPTAARAVELRLKFDQLFGTKTGYEALDQRIAKTLRKKTTLLTVLDHPEIPLHNNPAELDERVAARRRDVSLHCRHAAGADEMDTFTSIVQTAKKLLVNGYEYLYDRLSGMFRMPSLASLIQQRFAVSPTPPPRAPPQAAASSYLGCATAVRA